MTKEVDEEEQEDGGGVGRTGEGPGLLHLHFTTAPCTALEPRAWAPRCH